LLASSTYAYRVLAGNVVGMGPASSASDTVFTREGASGAHTTVSGSALVQGITGVVYERQIVTVRAGSSVSIPKFRLSYTDSSNVQTYTSYMVANVAENDVKVQLDSLTNLNDVRVSRSDTSTNNKNGHKWTVTFVGDVGNIGMLGIGFESTPTGVEYSVEEFVSGSANQFTVEPKKSVWRSCKRCQDCKEDHDKILPRSSSRF